MSNSNNDEDDLVDQSYRKFKEFPKKEKTGYVINENLPCFNEKVVQVIPPTHV